MSDFDQQEGNDRKSGKRKGKDHALQPGKVAGTDHYGQGGTGVTPGVPGKQTGTAQLPDGPNGTQDAQDAGKATDVDAKAQGAVDGKGEGKGKDGAAATGGGGDKDKKDADHGDAAGTGAGGGDKKAAGAGKGKDAGKTAQGDADKKSDAKDKGDAASTAGGDKQKAPMFVGKQAQPAVRLDIPSAADIPTLTLDVPKPNKSLSDRWVKETGRTLEQHHAQIQGLLGELQAEVQAKQSELMALSDQQATQVTQEIAAKVDSFKTAQVVPGRAKVEVAYGGLNKNFDTAEQKALAEIAKHKQTGTEQIAAARATNGQALDKKFVAAKALVQQVITRNVPIAAASIKQFATGIPGWVATAKKQATDAAKVVADKYNPSKGNAQNEASAQPSLTEDVHKNFTVKHGTKLGKQYEQTLTSYSKDIDKKADEVVRKALDESRLEFEMALDVSGKSSKKNLDAAATAATTALATSETNGKKSVADAKASGIKRFETEKKDALDAADKAGKELSDNSTAAGTELTDRIKKRAAEDSKLYAAIVADLQAHLRKGGPHKFEAVQPRIAAAKAQLLKAHTDNSEGLKQLVTEGTLEVGNTLTKQQEIYGSAIKDRQESATKCEAEVVKDIGKGATDMGASLANLAQGFTDTATKETQKLDAAIAAFHQNADAATKDFGNKVTQHLEGEKKKLDENLKANLEPQKIVADVEPDAAQELAAKKKSLSKDAATMRDAMDGWGTNENKIYGVLRKCSFGEIIYLEGVYNDHYSWRGKNGLPPLRADLADEMSGNDLKIAMSYLNHDRTTAIKLELADSTGFWNDDEARIEEIMKGASEEEIKFLNTDAEAKKVVTDVKNALGGADLDVVNTLLDTNVEREDRQSKASAIRLYDAMDGWGTNEAKMKEILEGAQTPEERARLRAHFNKYATSKGWEGGDGGAKGEEDDALTRAIKGDTSGGEEALVLTLAKTERSEEDVKIAKMYEGADGGGTNEDQIFDALDDKDYHEQWKRASPEDRKKLEEARRTKLDAKLDKMSGGEFKSVQGLIDGEMDKSPVTYEEFVNGKKADGRALTGHEIAMVKSRDPGLNRLEWMVAQRKLQTGQAEPELLLAYACWGVTGTHEELINKVLSNGGEPKSRAEIKAIRAAFHNRWGVALTVRDELDPINWDFPDPGGVLSEELGGKDWNKTRQLLCGKPETAEQLRYTVKLQAKYATSGLLGGTLMTVGEAVGATEAKTTMEKSEQKFDDFYQKNFAKDPKASLASANGERLQQLADYLSQDIEAYNAALAAIVDAVVTALEIIGGVIITVVTAGTASPVLAAVIANLVLSAGTITFKYAALGDQYGAGDLATDVVKAVGTSAFAGLGEIKALKTLTENAGKAVTGKLFTALETGVNQGGGRLIGTSIEMGPAGIKRLQGIVAAGTKNVIISTGQEVYNTLTDEKTYDKKLGDVLWGEESLGARILKNAPKAFAEGAVTQWINDAAGTANKDNRGRTTGPRSNALTNAIAEMGGATAGFFVYVDNYNDAEQFWIQLLKTNAQKGISGILNGYALHKTRAKKSARDFINGDMTPEALADMLRYLDDREVTDLAKFVEKYGAGKVNELPDAFKAKLAKKPDPTQPAPVIDPDHAVDSDPVAGPPAHKPPVGGDESAPVQPVKKADDDVKPPVVAKTPDETDESKQPTVKKADTDESKSKSKSPATTTKKNDDDTKVAKDVGDDEGETERQGKKVHDDEETRKDKIDDQRTKQHAEDLKKQRQADEQKKQMGQEDDHRRLSDSDDDFEGAREDRQAKRRAKRQQKEDADERRRQDIDDWEDAREAVAEGDAKRRAKKEARRDEKRKKAQAEKRQVELLDLATKAHEQYAGKIEEAKALLKQIVGDLGEVQGRAKDPESAANRLKRAEDNFGAKITDVQSAKDNIWDALGTRIVVSGKPEEMAAVMRKITDAIQAGKFEVVKAASNHGEGVAPFLTQADLDAINAASGGKADTAGGVKKADADKSAFTSGLIFIKYPDGTRGEIQIIGKATLDVAAIEHIPYDVSLGKPLARGIDEKDAPKMKAITAPVEEAIKALAKDPQKKAEYDQYLRDLYKHARATELGEESTPPKLPDGIDKTLSAEGLRHIYDQIEALKANANTKAGKPGGTLGDDEAPAKQHQEESVVRRAEIHLGDDTPAQAPTPHEAGLRGELDELWNLRGQLRRPEKTPGAHDDIKRKIAAAVEALDAKLKDPANKDAYLDPHVAFALAREASTGQSKALSDFLRVHIDSFRKAQDQARQGADPQLRAKREIFEREIAKQVLSGALKEQVDANLSAMCAKAIDYINKLPAARREQALAGLGVQAGGGYAGAVLTGNDTSKNAAVMLDVLTSGNARERMIALGNFAQLVASDMHRNPSDFDAVAGKATGAAGEFGAADVEAYRARMEQYKKDQAAGGITPDDKKYLADFLKPLSTEKTGAQKDYQSAKKQDMDTKLPSVSTSVPEGTEGLFHNPLPENAATPGATGAGEASTLARTTITVKEAQAMGYQLSEREIAAAGGPDGKLPWVVGTIANVVDPSAQFIATGSEHSLPQKAGISGTTFRFMEAAALLGGDAAQSRLAMIGALQVIDAHTIYEIASASKGFGLAFDPQRPYSNLGIPPELLDQLALSTGTTLAELNGETKANSPAGTKE